MCYNKAKEVMILENLEQYTTPEEQNIPETEGYRPRPKHQVWLARIGLVVFIIILIVYYMVYFRGGV